MDSRFPLRRLEARAVPMQQPAVNTLPPACWRPDGHVHASRRLLSSKRFTPKTAAQENEDTGPDVITKIFGAIFGKGALEERKPMGMQRMSEESMHELYPATTTEFADPVSTDDKEMALFRGLLAKTRIASLPLRLAYDADMDGWSQEDFHAKCNGYGSAIVLATTDGGALLGGYNPQGWIGLNEERDSNAAFLFTWPDGNTERPAIKLPKVGGPNLAVLDGASTGIRFGAEGLTINLQPGNEKQAKSRLGSYYAKLPGGQRSLFTPQEGTKCQLNSLKVYVAAGGKEEWTLDGIVWKSKAGAQ